ncbi:ureidoglycolate lyase [Endozoicomonas sp. ONNA1]|uniref:ureidoglycolate lyase n=1 Tax=Endozoicomonas sp. ONNA1 TaxID=2828740 RepID=UPI0034D17572
MPTTLTTRALPVEPLSAEAFKPFGDVIEACGDAMIINQGRCRKFNDLTRVQTDAEGEVAIHIYHTHIALLRSFKESIHRLRRHCAEHQCCSGSIVQALIQKQFCNVSGVFRI